MLLSSAGLKRAPVIVLFTLSCIVARGQPEPDFIIENTDKCVPSVVNFINNTGTHPGYHFLWDLGNNQLVYNQSTNVSEAYTGAGTYNVTLYLTDGNDTTRTTKTFTLYTPPSADFQLSENEGCAPLEVVFSDISASGDGNITKRSWDLRTGQLFADSVFSYTYHSPGNYGVLFRITDEHGCSDYIEREDIININPPPVADFTANKSFACTPPLQVNFTDQSSGSGLTYFWDLGNNDTTTERFPTTIYSTPGTYDVTLEIIGSGGCRAAITKENFIRVGQSNTELLIFNEDSPVTGNSDTICPGNLRFEVAGNSGGINYWTLDDNPAVIDDQFEVTFTDSGHHQLMLIHNHASTCPDTLIKSFFVDLIHANFSLEDTLACQYPLMVSPVNHSVNSSSVKWLLPSGKESNHFNPTDTAVLPADFDPYAHKPYKQKHDIILQAYNENGCMDSYSKTLRVNLPVARFVPDITSGCIPLAVSFVDSSRSEFGISGRKWFVNDELIAENTGTMHYTFEDEGVHESYLTITNSMGCIDTSYKVIVTTGTQAPLHLNVAPSSACYGDSVTINLVTGISDSIDYYHFNIPGAAKSGPTARVPHVLGMFHDLPGTYSLHGTVDYNGCITDTILENILYLKGPAGHFIDTFTCDEPYDYKFISHVDGAAKLQWQIADSVLSSENDTVFHTFEASGNYPVALTAVNDTSGCTITREKVFPVREVMAGFLAPSVACAGIPVMFNAGVSSDYITECYHEGFLWDFGDGSVPRRTYDTLKEHTFAAKGNFNVELTVSAENGCTHQQVKPISVYQPDASFSVNKDTFCAPYFSARFTAGAPVDPVKSYTWYFGDGAVVEGTEPTVEHDYTVDMNKSILTSLTVEDQHGCKAYHHVPIHVYKPNAEFYAPFNRGCTGDQVHFVVLESEPDSFRWDFGDGIQSTIASSHIYNSDGIYTVNHEVYKNGCTATTTKTGYISIETADASFSYITDSTYCYPVTINFTHTGDPGQVYSGSWSFAPQQSSGQYSTTAQYTYSKPGTYFPSLSVTTLNGCTDKQQHELAIKGPGGAFTIADDVACKGEPLTFTIVEKQDVEDYQWIFGDGNTGHDSVQHHVYQQGGYFVPSLKLTDQEGCEAIVTNDTVYVSFLEISLDTDKDISCVDEILTINNHVTGVSNYTLWMDDEVLAENIPEVTTGLPGAGIYRFRLIARDIHQCADTATKEIAVFPNPPLQASEDTSVCQGSSVMLFAQSEEGNDISWGPSTGLDDPSSNYPEASPLGPSTYWVTATGANGCQTTDSVNIKVILPPAITTRPRSDTTISKGQRITIGVETDPGTMVQWTPDREISCTGCPSPVIRPLENTLYVVSVDNRCFTVTDSIMVFVIIDFHLEMPDAFTPNGDGVNDVIHVKGKNIDEVLEFKVFNRWGNIVFETSDIDKGWDGTLNGKKLPSDTYTYFIRALTNHDYEISRKGTIILLD
jgi:gliding motility-associated-like protein